MFHSALRIFFLVRISLISGTLALLLLGQFLSESVLGSDAQPDEIQPTADTLDITNPGSDLANFPNSAFTLPAGGFYLEMTPVNLTSSSKRSSPQYNAEYLLRYGLLDDVEIRLYSQGFTVQGNPNQAVGFSPLTFDSKIHFWDEWKEYYLPAAGLEVLLQTDLLGSSAFSPRSALILIRHSLMILKSSTTSGPLVFLILKTSIRMSGTRPSLGRFSGR